MNQYNYYDMKGAEQINNAISLLPFAEKLEIQTKNGEDISGFRAIKVTANNGKTQFVNCPTKRYHLVQHKSAFEPILEGLTLAGVQDFKFILTNTIKKAELQIYTNKGGYDTVEIGFTISNSFDGTEAIKFGFDVNRAIKYIEICGYRQVCANGLKIRVPLNQAEIIRPELKIKLQELMSEKTKLLHTESVGKKLKAIQYVVEALALLREPIELYIKKAQKFSISDIEMAKEIIKLHVGKRYAKRVTEAYKEGKGNDLWALYNCVTYVASHDTLLKDVTRENLLNKASAMLTAELFNEGV